MLGQKSRRGKEGQDLLDPLEVGFRPNWAKHPAKQIGAIFSSAATPGGSRRPDGSRETGQCQTSE